MKRFNTLFSKPRSSFSPWILWTWNQNTPRATIERQLANITEMGVGGIAVAPGRDMRPALLSEEFLKAFELVLSTAHDKGIGVRLVCDLAYSWTTGIDLTMWRQRALRGMRLAVEHTERVADKGHVARTIEEPATALVIAAKLHDNKIISLSEIKTVAAPKGVLNWTAPAGEWLLLTLRKRYETDPSGAFIPNIFSPDCAAAYSSTVLRPIRERFSRFMAGTFKGIVLEMPPVMPQESSIPWDDDLVVKYRSRYKKELLGLLPLLYHDIDEGLAKHRAHLLSYLRESTYDRFCTATEAWLRKHHLNQWLLTSERNPAVAAGALRGFMGATDSAVGSVGIQCQEGQEEDYALVRAASSANDVEYRRETIAVVGRSVARTAPSLQSLRSEIDVALANGASQVLIDGFFSNIDQRASGKAGNSPFWYSSDWAGMKLLCQSAGAMRACLDKLHTAPSVAVLLPETSVYADYRVGHDDAVRRALVVMRRVAQTLRERNIEYDILSEEFILKCTVRQNGEFGTADRVRKGNYSVLVVPYARLISKSLLVFIEKLAQRKGTVVLVDEAPQGDLDGSSGRVFSERMEKLLEQRKDTIHVVPTRDLVAALGGAHSEVETLVNGEHCSDIHVRQFAGEGMDVYVMRNAAAATDNYVTISVPARRNVSIVQCDRSEIHSHPHVQTAAGRSTFGLMFSPQQTHVVLVSTAKAPVTKASKESRRRFTITTATNRSYRMVLKDQWVFLPISPNVVPLNAWNMKIGLSRESGSFSHFYETTFFVTTIPQRCYLALCGVPTPQEHGHLDKWLEVAVNGTRLPLAPGSSMPGCGADPHYAAFGGVLMCDLHGRLVAGLNRIIMRTTGQFADPAGVNYPPVMVGDFSIKKDSRGWVMDEPLQEIQHDSWTQHGFPYLSGVGEYRHVFEVPNKFEGLVLRFSAVSGSVDINLNNTDVGTVGWQPVEFDVTDFCSQKRNELRLRVCNTAENMLRLNGRPSGLTGEAYIDVY